MLRARLNALQDGSPRTAADLAAGRTTVSQPPPSKPSTAKQANGQEATQSPEQVLLAQVRAVHPDDPDRRKRAFRIFMEAVLKREFGTYLQPSGDLGKLVDQVIAQMDDDPELNRAAMAAAELLLAKAFG